MNEDEMKKEAAMEAGLSEDEAEAVEDDNKLDNEEEDEDEMPPNADVELFGKVIETSDFASFCCGGCNNTIELHKYIRIDEIQSIDDAWEKRHENAGDKLFSRTKYLGFCLCGNVYVLVK